MLKTEEKFLKDTKIWTDELSRKFSQINAQGTGNAKFILELTGDEVFYISRLLKDENIKWMLAKNLSDIFEV